MLRSLVGSEMCIRDRYQRRVRGHSRVTMDSSDSDDEVLQHQPSHNQPFDVEQESFPAFGGIAPVVASSSMNYSSAWASTKAPAHMPEPVRRRAPKPQAREDGPSQPLAESDQNNVPWRASDWANKMSGVPRWSASARPHTLVENYDPFASASSAVPVQPKPRAVAQPTPAPVREVVREPAPAPAPKKAPKQPMQDGDGFTEVVSKRPRGDKREANIAAVGKALETSSAFDALVLDQPDNSPAKPKQTQQSKPSKKPAANSQAKPKKEKKKKQPPAPVPAPAPVTQAEAPARGKKKSGKKKSSANKTPKETSSALPVSAVAFAAIFAALVALYFAKFASA
eukprot:TRINITY_DN26422_c0_g1_i1.p1 TRINITY_DN26422_c0_g1~~TRINITY_DN26422_c0_g1_i1.p1  ORF type:complete len:340 (-),score=65.55 TRINITY_DN26422_c0_g1_i1:307-1326(-)